jgi:nitrate reductase NapE component
MKKRKFEFKDLLFLAVVIVPFLIILLFAQKL